MTMLRAIIKRLVCFIAVLALGIHPILGSASVARADSAQVKELNFVFLHGAGSSIASFQLLTDILDDELLPIYIAKYEQDNPGTKVQVNMLLRSYPNNVDLNTWAKNVADSISKHFQRKKDLILVGHSMGGKVALYAVAQNIGGLADQVKMVVTINSPVRNLSGYYVAGGGSIPHFFVASRLLSDLGVLNSVENVDSSTDGDWVAKNKHWLAFVSGETTPLSDQFNIGGIDPAPNDTDDGLVPISAQYAASADVLYYGAYGHSNFSEKAQLAKVIADQMLRYIFGGQLEFSALVRSGSYQHTANWLPTNDFWQDVVAEVPVMSGNLSHMNGSFFKWQDWEDIIVVPPPGDVRSSFRFQRTSLPVITSIDQVRWLSPDNPSDFRLYLRTRAAPRSRLRVDWTIYQQGLLATGVNRDRYEVEISTGTPITSITGVSWSTINPRDLRLLISSQAQGPFRWFVVHWRVYFKQVKVRHVIDEIQAQ